jgi:carbon-monoxide dehydrogenase medium subunit
MKPPRFAYHDPATRAEALALLSTYADDAKVLAGGQSLVPLLNMRLAEPAHLVDINRLPDLAYIRAESSYSRPGDGTTGLVIGALARQRDIERSALVRQRCPLLAEAIRLVGHPPIRARGTICGSLAHADPAAELPAVLLALAGHVRAESRAGVRDIPAAALFIDQLQTALTPTELLVEAWFPAAPPRSGAAFIEISRRHGDYALAGVAAQLTLDEAGVISAAHLALIGVGVTPVRPAAAEALLLGERPGAAMFAAAGERATTGLDPNADIHASAEYRRHVAGVLVTRALHVAAGRATGCFTGGAASSGDAGGRAPC